MIGKDFEEGLANLKHLSESGLSESGTPASGG